MDMGRRFLQGGKDGTPTSWSCRNTEPRIKRRPLLSYFVVVCFSATVDPGVIRMIANFG
jgi:hypothetical protein